MFFFILKLDFYRFILYAHWVQINILKKSIFKIRKYVQIENEMGPVIEAKYQEYP